MQLTEVFDTNIKLEWTTRGRFELASFIVKDVGYVIQIERKPIRMVEELKNKKTAEVSFFTKTGNADESHTSTNKIGNAAPKVFGIVFNAIAEKFKQYDAFYFSAQTKHSKSEEELTTKSEIYLTLANSVAKRVSVPARVYDQRSRYGHAFLVSKIEIDDQDFINEALEYIKETK